MGENKTNMSVNWRPVLVFLLLLFCERAVAQVPQPKAEVGSGQDLAPAIVKALRESQVVGPARPLHALMSDDKDVVTIQTGRGEKSTDKDCQIDAVFISKKIFDSFPFVMKEVKVVFARSDDQFNEIDVYPNVISDYGAGKLTQEGLFAAIPVTLLFDESKELKVVDGPFRERRLVLLDRIQGLKERGIGVKPFMDIFEHVETLITEGKKTEAQTEMEQLAESIKAQDEMRKAQAALSESNRKQKENGMLQQSPGMSNSPSFAGAPPLSGRPPDLPSFQSLMKLFSSGGRP